MPARRAPSMTGALTFRLLNETRHVGEVPWGIDGLPQLWRYNLHYFDDLNAFDASVRREWHIEVLANWIHAHPPGTGDAWAPYPTSLRVANWIKWGLGGSALDASAIQSLATQVRALRQRLEYHLLGNHLFANARALVYAGLFFDGPEAVRWLDKGMSILGKEIPEQILGDGGQFERSPMYHALALEDVLDLINIAAAFRNAVPHRWSDLVASWPDLAQRMRAWLSAMCHPDGEISLFNDAAMGVAPTPAEIDRYANELLGPPAHEERHSGSIRTRHLADSGYVRADSPTAALIADVAPIGPDYLPGHAHADTLSFELSLFGTRVIVNGGTSRYGVGPERTAERGTAAHSTVTIDGQDSSEVWAGFRVARRARPFDLSLEQQEDQLRLTCAHDGYRRLPGAPVHRRMWTFQPNSLQIEDRVEGRFRTALARYHLHPTVRAEVDSTGRSGALVLSSGKHVRWHSSGAAARIEPSHYAPEFGRKEPTQCLALELEPTGKAGMQFEW
jgi:uncharacterized heparinase superfamily protein